MPAARPAAAETFAGAAGPPLLDIPFIPVRQSRTGASKRAVSVALEASLARRVALKDSH